MIKSVLQTNMYTIPVIPPDLRHEETIIQAAIALDCLQKTINSVFDRIDNRTQRNNAKVKELTERIDRAQAKIRGLVGTKKAIKILAPGRFPSTHVFRDIEQTFTGNKMSASESVDMVEQCLKLPEYDVQSRASASGVQAPQDKLVFFHVRSKEAGKIFQGGNIVSGKMIVNQGRDMGKIPENLRSASSLLRFNSTELVYSAEGAENDSCKRQKFFKHQRQLENEAIVDSTIRNQQIEPAPFSLANRKHKLTTLGSLRYTPRLNDAPEINLPLDLPDLPGIADDIHFEGKDQQQIAPSLFIEDLPDLLELEQEAVKDMQKTAISNNERTNELSKINEGVTTSLQPPPLNISNMGVLAPPPPPPPPPPPLQKASMEISPQQSSKKPTTVTEAVVISDARSDLMDAIRRAGGTRGGQLRAAAPIDVVDNREGGSGNNRDSNSIRAGNLMDDLHNKLLMRRKGISGAHERNVDMMANAKSLAINNAGNPVLSRLSALIPPPSNNKHSDDDTFDEDNDTDWAE